MWPAQQAMTPAEAGLAARVGLLENLRRGVTTIIDHQKLVASPAHSDAVAEAADVAGVIVDGRVLLRDGKLTGVDEAALLDECRAAARRLAKRLS